MCSYYDEQKWLTSFALCGCCCCACCDRRQIGMLRAIVNFYNLSQRAIADSPSDHKITWAYIKTTMHPVVQKIINSRSEEHTSELQSLKRTPYAVFCWKIK